MDGYFHQINYKKSILTQTKKLQFSRIHISISFLFLATKRWFCCASCECSSIASKSCSVLHPKLRIHNKRPGARHHRTPSRGHMRCLSCRWFLMTWLMGVCEENTCRAPVWTLFHLLHPPQLFYSFLFCLCALFTSHIIGYLFTLHIITPLNKREWSEPEWGYKVTGELCGHRVHTLFSGSLIGST